MASQFPQPWGAALCNENGVGGRVPTHLSSWAPFLRALRARAEGAGQGPGQRVPAGPHPQLRSSPEAQLAFSTFLFTANRQECSRRLPAKSGPAVPRGLDPPSRL